MFVWIGVYAVYAEFKAQPAMAQETIVSYNRLTPEELRVEGLKETLDMYIAIYGLQDKREKIYYTIKGESSWCSNLKGDLIHGIYHAEGCWMIWHEFHPDVSKSCINDFKCATEWTLKQWKTDKENALWTCAKDYDNGKKICNQK